MILVLLTQKYKKSHNPPIDSNKLKKNQHKIDKIGRLNLESESNLLKKLKKFQKTVIKHWLNRKIDVKYFVIFYYKYMLISIIYKNQNIIINSIIYIIYRRLSNY